MPTSTRNRKGCDFLIELEENKHKISYIKTKLKSIGDSLWHY